MGITDIVFRQPPFPSDGDPQADAIIGIGISSILMAVILFMAILIVYMYVKVRKPLPMIITWISEISLSFEAMSNPYFQPFSPSIEIFLILWCTGFFIMYALEFYTQKKETW